MKPIDKAVSLVPIRPNGSKKPLFLIHPAGGEIGYAKTLAPWINKEIPIYGLSAMGFIEGEEPLRSIEEMAAKYIDEILNVQKSGPYRLGGYSAGGIIAFEIAKQLIHRSEAVEFVGVIDGAFPNTQKSQIPLIEEYKTVLDAVENTIDISDFEFNKLKNFAENNDINETLKYCDDKNLVPSCLNHLNLRKHVTVLNATENALNQYCTSPSEIPITFFVSDDISAESAISGWNKIAIGGVKVQKVGGTHFSIVEKPFVETLGNLLSESMISK
jgi:thioesterase domain-containing protein